jgi:hypothetical protein
MYENFLKQVVLVRSVNAGVYFGTLEEVDKSTVRLSNVRNIYKWEGAACLAQIANEGILTGQVSQPVSEIILTEVCQIMPLTEVAKISLEKQPVWKL